MSYCVILFKSHYPCIIHIYILDKPHQGDSHYDVGTNCWHIVHFGHLSHLNIFISLQFCAHKIWYLYVFIIFSRERGPQGLFHAFHGFYYWSQNNINLQLKLFCNHFSIRMSLHTTWIFLATLPFHYQNLFNKTMCLEKIFNHNESLSPIPPPTLVIGWYITYKGF